MKAQRSSVGVVSAVSWTWSLVHEPAARLCPSLTFGHYDADDSSYDLVICFGFWLITEKILQSVHCSAVLFIIYIIINKYCERPALCL